MASGSSSALLWPRLFAALAVFLGFASASGFGQPAYLTVPATPYDRQMVRVHPLLAIANKGPSPISLLSVNQWMTELRALPYQYSGHWQTPAEVNLAQASDCKGKAVALYAQMRRNGAQKLRIVIGKHHVYDSVTHAWLEWERPDGSYMLDPTFNEMPIKRTELDPMTYVPLYAYDGAGKYRASSAGFLVPTTRVATGASTHFSLPTAGGTTFGQPSITGVGSRSFFPDTTQYLAPNSQRREWDGQGSRSNPRSARLSGVRSGGIRQPGGMLVKANAVHLIATRPIVASSRTAPTLNVRHSTTSAVKRPNVRSFAHHGRRVIRAHARRLASSS